MITQSQLKKDPEFVEMIIKLSSDGESIVLLPDFSVRMGMGVLKPFSKKREQGEEEVDTIEKILKEYFGNQFFEPGSIYSTVSIKSKDGRQYHFFLINGDHLMQVPGITIPISDIEKGKSVILDEEEKREYVPTYLLKEVVKLYAAII